jgi:recombinational DNA repair ATPase RecF
MRFRRLSVKHLRGIEAAELEFGPGLNVLHGPNDIGKSTLVAALRAALLLQYSSAEGQSLAPWSGDFVPEVDLSFERDQQLWRVRKTFGAGTRGSARLESSRDGVLFNQEATARQVEEKLRSILEWGIPSPGGKTRQHGLPRPFLAQALLGEQQDVDGILEASLEDDGTDSGRVRLTTALQAFAQDPRFKAISVDVQKQVDRFFTPQEKKRRGKGSPFQEATEEVAQLRGRLEELQKKKQSSDATVAGIAELRQQLEGLSRNRDEAKARLGLLAGESKAAAARLQATAELERATAVLAEIDEKAARAAAKVAELGALTAAQDSLSKQEQKAASAVAELTTALGKANEALREVSSDKAAAARELKRAAMVTEEAVDAAEAADVERQRVTAEEAGLKTTSLKAQQAELDAKRHQLQTVEAAIAKAEQDARDAAVMHARLLAAYGLLKWKDSLARVEKARRAADAARASKAAAEEARREAEQLRAEISSTPLPDAAEIRTLVELEHQLQLADAALGGGLTLSVRAKKPLKLSARTDGGREQKMSGTEATLDALRTIHLSIPGVADVEVSAGDEQSRARAAELRQRWDDAQPVLKRAGVTTPKGLQELREKRDARERTAEARAQAAVQLDKDALSQSEEAQGLKALEAQAGAYEADLVGHDREMLAQIASKLPVGAGDPSNTAEAKSLMATVTAAQKAVAAGRASQANLEGQLSQLEAKVEESHAAVLDAERTLGGMSPAVVLAAVAEKVKQLGARRATREAYVGARANLEDQSVVTARTAVEGADARLKEARQAQEAIGKQLEAQRSKVDQARGQHAQMQAEAASLDRPAAMAAVAAKRAAVEALPLGGSTAADLESAQQALERAEAELTLKKDELRMAEGALTQVGGAVVTEQVEDYAAALAKAQERQTDLESDADAWNLLRNVLRECESVGAKHVGAALGDDVSRRFQALTHRRYGGLAMDAHLKTVGVQAAGERRGLEALSVGTRDQVATLLRLAIAESLGSVVVLDDHLVQTDPERLKWFVEALTSAAKKIQVIVVTCRRRDYESEGNEAVTWVDLDKAIRRAPTSGVPA